MARFSELLQKHRKAKKLTQDGLARLTGLSTSTITKLEQPDLDMEPGWRTVQKICAVLDLDVTDFVEKEVMDQARMIAKMLSDAWATLPPTEPAEPLSSPSEPKQAKKKAKKRRKP